MIDDRSLPDFEEEQLARFIRDLEGATDRAAVVRRYAAEHPALADEFNHLEEMSRLVDRTGNDKIGDNLMQLGEFRIVRRIAAGGMGVIYEAVQERLNRRVAVKTIRRGHVDEQLRARFFREQRVLARLHQTHIVPIHAAGEEGDLLYFAMPFIDGVSLQSIIWCIANTCATSPSSRVGTVTQLIEPAKTAQRPTVRFDKNRLAMPTRYFRSVAAVIADAAEALDHAHRLQILHRDIKPSNLLVDRQGQCWIIDFGLAGYIGKSSATDGEIAESDVAEALTTGQIVGTPQYMAPERWRGEPTAVASDIWSLGATLYELLTLRIPFDEDSLPKIRDRALGDEPTPPRRINKRIPFDLDAICRKAMRKDPGDRYASAQLMADDLRRWLRFEPVTASGLQLLRRPLLWAKRNPGWASALVLTVLSLVGIALAAIEIEHRQSQESNRGARLVQMQKLRGDVHQTGWRDAELQLADQVFKLRPGDDLRDEIAANAIDWDASPIISLHETASGVAFDAEGERLLLGGTNDFYGRPKSDAAMIDAANGATIVRSGLSGAGPVAFAGGGTPCQLASQADDARTILFRDIGRQRDISQVSLAPGATPLPLMETTAPVRAISADGRRAAASTSRADKIDTLAVWETATGRVLHRWSQKFESLAFTPDGAFLAAGDSHGRITIFPLDDDSATPTLLQSGEITVTALAFGRDPAHPAGRSLDAWQLAVGDVGSRVAVWDLRARQYRCHCDGAWYGTSALEFSPDGMTLASGGRHVMLWDATTGRLHLKIPSANEVSGLAFDRTGSRLAVCSGSGSAASDNTQVWKLESGRETLMLSGLVGPVAKLAFSTDSQYLAALSHQWQVAVWHLPSRKLLHVLDGPHGEFVDNAAIIFDPATTRLACAGGTQAKLWNLATGALLQAWDLPIGLQDALAFDATGQSLWSVRCETETGEAPYMHADPKTHPRIYPLRNLFGPEPVKPATLLHAPGDQAMAIVMAFDGSTVVCNTSQREGERVTHTVRAFAIPAGSLLWTASASGSELCPDGSSRLVGYSTSDSIPIMVDQRTGEIVRSDGDMYTTTGPWRIPRSRYRLDFERATIADLNPESKASSQGLFSPDGRFLAIGRNDGSVIVYDLDAFRRQVKSFDNP